MKRIFLGGATAVLMLVLSHPAPAQTDPKTIADCESCHGPKGDSRDPSTPRLNGQRADYLAARLDEFKNLTGQTPHAVNAMWQRVMDMRQSSKLALAQYFAQAEPSPAQPGSLANQGRDIYQHGIAAEKVPDCAGCHGAAGEGTAAGPRLAGQQGEYLKTQLWAFNFNLRVHARMQSYAIKFSSHQIDALASYLQGR